MLNTKKEGLKVQSLVVLIVRFLFLFYVLNVSSAMAESLRLQRDGPIARDYVNKLEWMRCSLGQLWDNDSCLGEALMLSVLEANEVVKRMSNLEGGGWRIPSLKELQSIVSKVENRPDDFEPNIDKQTFPNTFAGSYWSSDKSFYSKRYQWSVNFITGHGFNRFLPSQKLAVRLVRDFQIR